MLLDLQLPDMAGLDILKRVVADRLPCVVIVITDGEDCGSRRRVTDCASISSDLLASEQFTLAFVGYDDEANSAVLELTYNWDRHAYTLGDAFGHVAIGVEDAYAACDAIRTKGGKVTREPGPMKHGGTVIAFVEDPNGYKIELIQTGSRGAT